MRREQLVSQWTEVVMELKTHEGKMGLATVHSGAFGSALSRRRTGSTCQSQTLVNGYSCERDPQRPILLNRHRMDIKADLAVPIR